MRHKISEILKDALNMKIQDVKRKIKNNKRIATIRRRTRRQNSDKEDSKSVTSEEADDSKQLAALQPFFEQGELQNIPTIKEYIKLEEDNQNNKYDFKITEKSSSSSYTSSSSISSLESNDVHISNKELLLKLTKRRKQSLPKKSKFIKRQQTMLRSFKRIRKVPSFVQNRNTTGTKELDDFESSRNDLGKSSNHAPSSKK